MFNLYADVQAPNNFVPYKTSELEKIRSNPENYIGSLKPVEEKLWVYDEEKDRFLYKEVKYVPALIRIFDEILLNAAENYYRKNFSFIYYNR